MILAPIKIQWKIHVRVCFWAVSFILLLYVYSYANATLSWSLSYILKSGNVCSPNLFFIKIVLAVVPDISISAKKGSAIGPSNSVQFSRSVVSDCLQVHEPQHARPPCPSPTPRVHPNPCPSNRIILCHPLLLLPSVFLSIKIFTNESALCLRWPTYWSFSFNISPSNEHPGLISFRMDWLDLLAVQGTLKSLLQHHSSSGLQHSAFFMVQLSHLYMTIGKTIALTIGTFVCKVRTYRKRKFDYEMEVSDLFLL